MDIGGLLWGGLAIAPLAGGRVRPKWKRPASRHESCYGTALERDIRRAAADESFRD